MPTDGPRLGAFVLERPLGEGSMGRVWFARHEGHGTPVAVKVVTAEHARNPQFRELFERELQTVAGLSHPHITRLFAFGAVEAREAAAVGELEEGNPWLAMEFADGGSFEDHIIPDFEEFRALMLELLDALSHAHARRIVHRDLKPENVLLAIDDDEQPHVKLSDFGIAHAVDPELNDSTKVVQAPSAGTPLYMAPEQFRGDWRVYGPWTDLYALGCMAYEMCCGILPFDADSILDIARMHLRAERPELRPRFEVPDGLEAWLWELMARHPSGRFQCAADAARRLARLGGGNAATSLRAPEDWRLASERSTVEEAIPGVGLELFGLRELPLVGREDERDRIWSELQLAREQRRPRVIIIEGEPGSGKSRLAEWISRRAHELGAAEILEAHHDAFGGESTGLTYMVERYLRCTELDRDKTVDQIRRELERLGVPSYGDDDETGEWDPLTTGEVSLQSVDVEALTELVRMKDEGPRSSNQWMMGAGRRHAVILTLLRRIAERRPALVWLDDVHWSADALSFVDYALEAARSGADFPALFVLTARDEEDLQSVEESLVEALVERPEVTRLELAPLDTDEQRTFVRELLPMDEETAHHLQRRSMGNPMVAKQTVADWIMQDALELDARGRFRLRDREIDTGIQEDLHDFWTRRIMSVLTRCGAPYHGMIAMELAATLGQEVDLEQWREACERRGSPLPESLLDAMIAGGLAVRRDRGWAFSRGLLHETLLRNSRGHGRHSEHHAVCAEVLAERREGARGAARIARHLLAAGRLEEAIEPLLEAATHHKETGAMRTAHQHLDTLRDVVSQIALAPADLRLGEAALLRAGLLFDEGDARSAERGARWALEQAERFGWRGVDSEALKLLGLCLLMQGEPDQARRYTERALELDERRGDDARVATALRRLARIDTLQGRLEAARRELARARAIHERRDEKIDLAWCALQQGYLARSGGDLERARQLLEEALELFREYQVRTGEADALGNLADLDRLSGHFDRAEEAYRDCLSIQLGLGVHEAHVTRLNLALTLLQRGDFEAARAPLEQLLADYERAEHAVLTAFARAALLAATIGLDDLEAADEHLEALEPLLEGLDLQDQDLAVPLTIACERCVEAEEGLRAERIGRLARSQWTALGDEERAHQLAEKIASNPDDRDTRTEGWSKI